MPFIQSNGLDENKWREFELNQDLQLAAFPLFLVNRWLDKLVV
jgi:hypothetical protein